MQYKKTPRIDKNVTPSAYFIVEKVKITKAKNFKQNKQTNKQTKISQIIGHNQV